METVGIFYNRGKPIDKSTQIIFTFDSSYVEDPNRDILSLSFNEELSSI